MNILMIGGKGDFSGVPRYISRLSQILSETPEFCLKLLLIDINQGGYDACVDLYLKTTQVPGLDSASSFTLKFSAFFSVCRHLFTEQEGAIVWANSSFSCMFVRIASLFFRNKFKYIYTYHGVPYGPGRSFFKNFLFFSIEFLSLMFMYRSNIIVISRLDLLAVKKIAFRHKVFYIPNSGHLNRSHTLPLNLPIDNFLVMTTRDQPQKNLDYAAKIAAGLHGCDGVVVVGNVSLERIAELKELSLGKMYFVGAVRNVEPYLSAASGYLMTSRYEGFSLGMIEAGLSGLPIFSTNVGGFSEAKEASTEVFEISGKHLEKDIITIETNLEEFIKFGCRKGVASSFEKYFGEVTWFERNLGMLNGIV